MNRADSSALAAGALAGVAGLLVFLMLHALWIVPIWFILPLGLLVAGCGGVAVGWAYAELRYRLPRRPWTALAVVGVIAVILSPAFMLAELQAPVVHRHASRPGADGCNLPDRRALRRRIAGDGARSSAAWCGWWLGRTRRAALATAVAGFVFALGPGHNIPFIGGTPGVGKELAIMAVVIGGAALVLVEVHAWLSMVVGATIS
jgi:hypothetical protein